MPDPQLVNLIHDEAAAWRNKTVIANFNKLVNARNPDDVVREFRAGLKEIDDHEQTLLRALNP